MVGSIGSVKTESQRGWKTGLGENSAGKAATHVRTARVRAICGLMAGLRPESGRFRRCDPVDGSLSRSESCRKTRARLLAARRPGKSPPTASEERCVSRGPFFGLPRKRSFAAWSTVATTLQCEHFTSEPPNAFKIA